MNTPVKFDIAKLLKEKGFNEQCNQHYSQALFEGTNLDWEGVFPKYSVFKHSNFHYNSTPNSNDLWFECSAPTIVDVVMWLYEKYGRQMWCKFRIQILIKQNNMISKQFNPHDIKVGDLVTGYHKGFHQVTCIKERWYSKDFPGGAEKESNSFSKEGSPLVYYKKMYNDDGTPTKAKKRKLL